MSDWISKVKALAAVEEEEELSGDMPPELWERLKNADESTMTEMLRIVIRTTKKNISQRIDSL